MLNSNARLRSQFYDHARDGCHIHPHANRIGYIQRSIAEVFCVLCDCLNLRSTLLTLSASVLSRVAAQARDVYRACAQQS
jgi:hypothetical protein